MKAPKNRYYSRPGNDEPVVITPRPCMCCRQTFESEGIHNRLCKYCKTLATVNDFPCEVQIR